MWSIDVRVIGQDAWLPCWMADGGEAERDTRQRFDALATTFRGGERPDLVHVHRSWVAARLRRDDVVIDTIDRSSRHAVTKPMPASR